MDINAIGLPAFDDVLRRLDAGDDESARQMFDRFVHRLIAVARSQIEREIGHKEDPDDVVQSVYRSFFRSQRQGDFARDGWDSIWNVLTIITVRKCANRFDTYQAARRDIAREVLLPEFLNGIESLARAGDPTLAHALILSETLHVLMRALSPGDRQILTLHLQGCHAADVASRVGYSRRTVQRALARIRGFLVERAALYDE